MDVLITIVEDPDPVTEGGEIFAEPPFGNPDTEIVTPELKPPEPAIVTV